MSVASPLSTTPQPYDVARVRADFPVLATTVRGKRIPQFTFAFSCWIRQPPGEKSRTIPWLAPRAPCTSIGRFISTLVLFRLAIPGSFRELLSGCWTRLFSNSRLHE